MPSDPGASVNAGAGLGASAVLTQDLCAAARAPAVPKASPPVDVASTLRPASASGRFSSGQLSQKKLLQSAPAAGRPSNREAFHASLPSRGARRAEGFGMNKKNDGWQPKTLPQEPMTRRDPICHTVDVYNRSVGGSVQHCSIQDRKEMMQGRAHARPPSAGRRKGLAEYADLCAPGQGNWNPSHAAALSGNRRVFHVQKSDLMAQQKDIRGRPGGCPSKSKATGKAEVGQSAGSLKRPESAPNVRSPVQPAVASAEPA